MMLTFNQRCCDVQLSIGSVRTKNAKNIAIKILLDLCLGGLAWYVFGYAFCFGGTYGNTDKANSFIGYTGFALNQIPKSSYWHWFFELAVCLPCQCSQGTSGHGVQRLCLRLP